MNQIQNYQEKNNFPLWLRQKKKKKNWHNPRCCLATVSLKDTLMIHSYRCQDLQPATLLLLLAIMTNQVADFFFSVIVVENVIPVATVKHQSVKEETSVAP